jgi:hypothetical protein
MPQSQDESGVSRRDFLKGAAIVAAAAGTGSLIPVVRNAGATSVALEFSGTELLGRPTDRSIMLNLVGSSGCEAYVEYGTIAGDLAKKTEVVVASAEAPLEFLIDDLEPSNRYFYRLMYREKNSKSAFVSRPEYSFHTQRKEDEAFVFTIISDSHLNDSPPTPSGPASQEGKAPQAGNAAQAGNAPNGENASHAGGPPAGGPSGAMVMCDPDLYTVTCQNVQKDTPDLHFDLGDTFVMTKLKNGDVDGIRKAYMSQRPFMGQFSHSTPVFLALGNHEEEEGWNLDDEGENVSATKTIIGANARKRYYLNPKPDGFYTGNSDDSQKEIDGDHLKENYYSFEWGCSLFVVLDPFSYTTEKPYMGAMGGENLDDEQAEPDRWRWTLGKKQYAWLKKTLEQSDANFKFVMSHQVAGGCACGHDLHYGRGGEKATHSHEWGASPEEFAAHRPDFPSDRSIHQLFLDNGVNVFFHGHDHIYAREEVDGMIYQECPFPANPAYGSGFGLYQDEPPSTVVKNNSGHLRISVSPKKVTVDYVRAYLPGEGENGHVEYSYTVEA